MGASPGRRRDSACSLSGGCRARPCPGRLPGNAGVSKRGTTRPRHRLHSGFRCWSSRSASNPAPLLSAEVSGALAPRSAAGPRCARQRQVHPKRRRARSPSARAPCSAPRPDTGGRRISPQPDGVATSCRSRPGRTGPGPHRRTRRDPASSCRYCFPQRLGGRRRRPRSAQGERHRPVTRETLTGRHRVSIHVGSGPHTVRRHRRRRTRRMPWSHPGFGTWLGCPAILGRAEVPGCRGLCRARPAGR